MKTKSFFFFFPVIVFSFFSCDVMKKRYSSGFYFSKNNNASSSLKKEKVQPQVTASVNHAIQLGYQPIPNFEIEENNIAIANSVKMRNPSTHQKQRNNIEKPSPKISSESYPIGVEKIITSNKKNNSATPLEGSGSEAHGFVIATICLYFLGGIFMLVGFLWESVVLSVGLVGFLFLVLGTIIYKIGIAFSYVDFFDFTTAEKILLVLSYICAAAGFLVFFIAVFGM